MEQQIENKSGKRRERAGIKLLIISLLCILLLIPWFLIRITISDRDKTETNAEKEVYAKWGGEQIVKGPAICCLDSIDDKTFILLPETLDIDVETTTRTLNRGIYDFTVYDAIIAMKGTFTLPKNIDDARLNKLKMNCWNMEVDLSSLKGLSDNPKVILDGTQIDLQDITFDGSRLMWQADLSGMLDSGELCYEITIPLRGSNSLKYLPTGNTTTVKMHSDCVTPSFCGDFLPTERNVTKEGFDAEWKVLAINRCFSQILNKQRWNNLCSNLYSYSYIDDEDACDDAFGVELKRPVEQYQQNERAVKYAYLIVLLTFAIVFFIELRRENPIHPVQYLLIGIAIMLFYTLLLSFSEHLSFLIAYIIATVMTVTLIAVYLSGIMHDKKVGLLTGGILTVCYTFIYILLQIESYALLVGSIGLFIVLAVAMQASKKIDWNSSTD